MPDMTNDKREVAHGSDLETRRGGNWDRREFVKGAAALASFAALMGYDSTVARAEPPPETKRIRLSKIPGICIAPQYVAEELLHAEGFTDVEYVTTEAGAGQSRALASGEIDATINYAAPLIIPLDAGQPIVVLAGIHVGCFELFGHEPVRALHDLKGRSVGVQAMGSSPHVFLVAMARHVGLDPERDIKWVTDPLVRPKVLFEQGKIDAFLGFPPEPQELRSRRIGRVIIDSSVDRPWSQYFCCMIAANRDFVDRNPVATKRLVRAMLKASDLCAAQPERAARLLVDGGFTPNHDYALQTMKEISYRRWRDYNPEDTIRFYALRLQEAGMIKSSPQKLIAQGTDWRFLNELKKELKA
jgi:NitT/TauT family transport system substrate-binding protein